MDTMERVLKQNVDNPIVYAILAVFIGMYGPRLAPRLPEPIMNLFKNQYFRFGVLLLVVYASSRDLQLSLLISLVFLVIVSIGNYATMEEQFENMVRERFENMENSVETSDSQQVDAMAEPEGEEIVTPVESTSRAAMGTPEVSEEAATTEVSGSEGFAGSEDTYRKLQDMEQRIINTIREKYSNY